MSSYPPEGAITQEEIDKVSERLRRFVHSASRNYEASADDLVRVRVGRTLNVISVELLDPKFEGHAKQQLETAIASAVNAALQRAALAAGDALADIGTQTKTNLAL
jgi:DNA-binding protein YbaB